MMDEKFENFAKIKVFGVGGGGCNAVNRMIEANEQGVEFYICNTDAQDLKASNCPNKIYLGEQVTKGLGAGADPEKGKEAALESEAEIRRAVEGADMIFITAGLGGGTGTGAAPIFAKIAKESGALTVGVVTKPFSFEGTRRNDQAEIGLENLKEFVDSLIIISNNKILEEIGNIPINQAFKEVDDVLRQGVKTITDLIAVNSLINLDFADVRTVMQGQGSALFGVGLSGSENKASEAAKKAIESKLLEAKITGAKNAIINVSGGPNLSILEANEAVETIRREVGGDIDIIFGVSIQESLKEQIVVSVIATGFDIPNSRSSINYQNSNIVNEVLSNKNPINTTQNDESKEKKEIPTFFKNDSRF